MSDTQGQFHTYAVEWTSSSISWIIDGTTVRTLTPADADPGQYPQTPCQLKVGAWSAGDPQNNAQGTITWAKGPTDFSAGPFSMVVQSISVVDYSTGTSYSYGDQSGSWSSIEASGGKVGGNAGGDYGSAPAPAASYPAASGSAPPSVSFTSYPGLPPGWTVNPSTGKVIAPSSASVGKQSPLRGPVHEHQANNFCSQPPN